jgi:hypothetical protein
MAATMGQNKGKRGEREIKDAFIEVMEEVERLVERPGVSAEVKRNTTQSDRGGFDIVGIPLLAIEVKRQETLVLNVWWKQCYEQAGRLKLRPVLIYRQNRKSWRVQTYGMLCQPGYDASTWVRIDIDFGGFLDFYRELYREWLIKEG